MKPVLRIGNASAFWGDRTAAAAELAAGEPRLDVLTLDYLAELSMSILARQRDRDPKRGYPNDFIDAMTQLAPVLAERQERKPLKVITNGGGLAPADCAAAVAKVLLEHGGDVCRDIRVAIVEGDDVLSLLRNSDDASQFRNLETDEALANVQDRLVTANAYIGADAVVQALRDGAQIVIAGRLADPSMAVAPCIAHFGWAADDWPRVAGATVAGHLIECGTQVTGGVSTHWLDLPDLARIGYPVVEVSEDGSCVVTKPANTGGRVDLRTVKEQLVYEIGDPANYLSPDARVSFLSLAVNDEGNDRVSVRHAAGTAPPPTLKVSASYRSGWRAAGSVVVVGEDAVPKARRCAALVRQRLENSNALPKQWLVECLGAGDSVPIELPSARNPREVVLRLSVADERRDVVEAFSRELMPLVTCGPQGVCGYAEGRPRVHEVYSYWPCLIERSRIKTTARMMTVSQLIGGAA